NNERSKEPKTPFGYPNPRDAVEPGWGNKSISLKLCRNVIIRDVTILHGGHFAILATGVDNLTIDNLKIDTNRDGIDIDACRNVLVYNAEPKYGSIISGIPGHEIEDLTFSNIRIYYKGGGSKQQAALEPAEKETDYPEPAMFGEIPAYGFFIRHVRGIEMNDV